MTPDRAALDTALRILFDVLLSGGSPPRVRARILDFLKDETNRLNPIAPEKTE